ncbi:glycosyltransferase [Nibricoccus sp. IMCC34717]|uniref:glycosyltransferase n=1 Tax=Nibricoccus sp. IMCC34717 TaxID=3034021 RepID=UPI00384C3239
MRLLLVTSLLRGGGAERVAAELASGFAAAGHQVEVLVLRDLDGSDYPTDPRVRVRALALVGENNPWWHPAMATRLVALRKAIRQVSPDLVIGFQDKLNCAVLLATLGLRVPVVCTEHVVPGHAPLGWFWETLRRLYYRRATAVVAPTRSIAQTFSAHGANAEVIPYPAPSAPLSARIQKQNTLSPVIRAAGRLAHVKGFDLLIRAFATLAAEHPDWRLEIAGSGDQRLVLELLATSLGVAGRVTFVGRVADVVAFFSGAAAVAIPSRSEAFPMVLLEAWAAGGPVVASRSADSLREMAGDAVEWAEPEDSASLAQALEQLLSDPHLGARKQQLGTERLSAFLPERVMGQWNARLAAWGRDSR